MSASAAYYSGLESAISNVLKRGSAKKMSGLKRYINRKGPRTKSALKSRSASRVETVQKKKKTTFGQQNQLSRQDYNSGRKPKVTVQYLNKLVKTNQQHYTLRFGGINAFSAGSGYYKLDLGLTSGAGNLPCHLYDITSCVNYQNSIVQYANPGWQCRQNGANVEFTNLSQQAANGTTAVTNWTFDQMPQAVTAPGNFPLESSVLDWFQARFILYGARNRPVKYLIQLVQFSDEDNDPARPVNLKRSNLFQSMLKPFTYNPIADTDTTVAKRVKVLKAWTHLIQPDQSTNLDTAPLQKEFNVFMRMNRQCRWNWSERDLIAGATDAYQQADYLDQTTLDNSYDYHERVHPRARIFLMIRALSTTPAAAFDPLVHPSYDMKIRTRHTYGS